MTDEKWEDLKENIREKFTILEEKSEPDVMTDDLGNEIKGTKESIVFIGPFGKMLAERTTRPVILDRKTHYRKTQTGKALVEYIVSDTEFTHKINLYKWDDTKQDWGEIDVREDKISF